MYCYWGKARPDNASGAQWHLLVYHSLDVAAAGKAFLERHHTLRRSLARVLELDEETFLAWTVFFLALHDLGKFAEGFQNQRPPDLFFRLHGYPSDKDYSVRHDSLGFVFWKQALWPVLIQEDWLNLDVDEFDLDDWEDGFSFWARAVTGHHGQPPKHKNNGIELILRHHFTPTDQEAAMAFSRVARDLILSATKAPSSLAADEFYRRSARFSWWLAGVAVLADWIGSNAAPDWFPYCNTVVPLIDYWQETQVKAMRGLDKTGVLPAAVSPAHSLGELFPRIGNLPPTPLQKKAASLHLGDGPQLLILEDVTGAGKTEAALLLAHRLMAAGQGQGIYIGLPTMATADAMYGRMMEVCDRLFATDARPSLVLAHSARHLSERFRDSILPLEPPPERDYGLGEQSATARCTAWLADGRKKALLAAMGVGTIDQALQSILYSKHQSLRLLGLFRKLLIIDEVHACDAYMHQLLKVLLTFHAAAGGSAILLSATLPHRMRRELVQAFCEGVGQPPPTLKEAGYPLLTHIGGPGQVEHQVDTRNEVRRTVAVDWLTALEAVIETMIQAAAMGRCVCWIRNTVADARAAYAALQGKMAKDKLELFHARFAMADRLKIERRVIESFGKDSRMKQRTGQVVVATPVVEQSLDLDFDLLISDLAPIDLLIQRAGRLCRHIRDEQGNPLDGPNRTDQRGIPRLVVYGPEPIDEPTADWFSAMFPKASFVYPDHGRLWLTARLLRQRGRLRMPEDARDFIEGVYGDNTAAIIPETLQKQHRETEGDALAKTAQARGNSIKLDEGYVIESLDWWSDALTPTRLGDPESTVRLAFWDGDTLGPWHTGSFAWDLSQVRVRQAWIKDTAMPTDPKLKDAIDKALATLPDKGRWSVLLPLCKESNGLWSGIALNSRGDAVQVFYDSRQGLRLRTEEEGQA